MTGNGSGLTGVANTDVVFPDKISFGDNGRINLGVSSDIQIYHDSSDNISKIDNTTANVLQIRNLGNNKVIIKTQNSHPVELYYNNGLKLETVNDGVNVSGALATSTSSLTVSSCPIPQPFAYAKLDDDGTAATSETKIGAGATVTAYESNAGEDINWDDSNDYFTVLKHGTYELTARVVLEVDATTVVTLKVKDGTTVINTFSPKINSAVDPQEATLHAVFPAAANANISVTHADDASTNVNAGAGTTLMIKRLM